VTSRLIRRAVGAAALVGLLGACGLVGGGDDVDGESAEAALEQQRTDIRDLARELQTATEQAVSGSTLTARGRWEGCDSAFNDVFRNFRYTATVRMDAVAPGSGDLLAPLSGVAQEAGLTEEASDDPAKLRASREGLTVSFWQLPEATPEGDLLISVYGECIDVAEDDREEWTKRRETDPEL